MAAMMIVWITDSSASRRELLKQQHYSITFHRLCIFGLSACNEKGETHAIVTYGYFRRPGSKTWDEFDELLNRTRQYTSS